MSSLCLIPLTSCASWKQVTTVRRKHVRTTSINCTNDFGAKSFFLNPSDERILKKALKEPVAFMGGMFAGLLRLDLNEDPLKEWVTRTVEASGITEDELDPGKTTTAEEPQQIEIE
ncbi:hypothetical protein L6452_15222 [Arctium lappa]|uniref:Uncharacterized protein n=1 Tax=Arctium lappa TaxID=4217 RepID=A0ACB9CN48_ARCLA|nr:hypothetical protein L6452_15222 [Arctium lappa]